MTFIIKIITLLVTFHEHLLSNFNFQSLH